MNRSKQGALEELLILRDGLLHSVKDETARKLLTADLVSKVLEIAWSHQFEDDRAPFRSEVQQVINDAIEAHFLKEH